MVPIDCIGKIFRNLPENQVVPKAALKFPAGIARTGASRHTYGNHLSFLPYEIVEVLHTGVFNKDITGTFEPLMFGGQGVQTPVSPLLFRFGLDERPFLRLGTPVASVGSGAIPLSSFIRRVVSETPTSLLIPRN